MGARPRPLPVLLFRMISRFPSTRSARECARCTRPRRSHPPNHHVHRHGGQQPLLLRPHVPPRRVARVPFQGPGFARLRSRGDPHRIHVPARSRRAYRRLRDRPNALNHEVSAGHERHPFRTFILLPVPAPEPGCNRVEDVVGDPIEWTAIVGIARGERFTPLGYAALAALDVLYARLERWEPYADVLFRLPKVPTLLQPLVATVPLQLFACELATAKGHDVDQPRNLAKSVTVE